MKEIKNSFMRFSYWFDIKFGWFFVNGRKIEKWNKYIEFLIEKKLPELNGA